MYSIQELAEDFRKLGIRAGDTVMLHASVRAVGEIAGGPDAIHLALKSVLTPEGTLMMYASCPRYYDEVGRGNLTAEQEREIREKLPVFDPLTARSARDNGALVELLRTYPDSRVNPHVARFVFWGKQTEHLMSIQPWNYALGSDSPLERFLMLDGKIVLLGSDHDAVTFLHYVEHVAEIPSPEFFNEYRHSGNDPAAPSFRYANLAPLLLRCAWVLDCADRLEYNRTEPPLGVVEAERD